MYQFEIHYNGEIFKVYSFENIQITVDNEGYYNISNVCDFIHLIVKDGGWLNEYLKNKDMTVYNILKYREGCCRYVNGFYMKADLVKLMCEHIDESYAKKILMLIKILEE